MAKRKKSENVYEADRRFEACRVPERAEILDLSHSGLKKYPESVGGLSPVTDAGPSRQRLDVAARLALPPCAIADAGPSRQRLDALLPQLLGYLARLQWLYLADNRLTELPAWFGRLSWLQTIYLRGNRLTSLPESLGGLGRLWRLDLSDNNLTSLPESFKQVRLGELYLHGNEGLGIPSEILGPTLEDVKKSRNPPAYPPRS